MLAILLLAILAGCTEPAGTGPRPSPATAAPAAPPLVPSNATGQGGAATPCGGSLSLPCGEGMLAGTAGARFGWALAASPRFVPTLVQASPAEYAKSSACGDHRPCPTNGSFLRLRGGYPSTHVGMVVRQADLVDGEHVFRIEWRTCMGPHVKVEPIDLLFWLPQQRPARLDVRSADDLGDCIGVGPGVGARHAQWQTELTIGAGVENPPSCFGPQEDVPFDGWVRVDHEPNALGQGLRLTLGRQEAVGASPLVLEGYQVPHAAVARQDAVGLDTKATITIVADYFADHEVDWGLVDCA